MRPSLVPTAFLALLLAAPAPAKEPGGSVLVLAAAKEPGTRLVIAGRIWKADGKTPAGAERVLVYHTDARGDYGSRPGATAAQGTRDARLSGFPRMSISSCGGVTSNCSSRTIRASTRRIEGTWQGTARSPWCAR